MSNLHSVQAACNKVGLSSAITMDEDQIMKAKVAILPGVGAFGEAMLRLTNSKLIDTIYRFIDSGKPFIGICLGLQLLFDQSDEFGNHKGLGLINGTVKKFPLNNVGKTKYPVPHIGWNRIQKNSASWENTLLRYNHTDDFMYFVHSYYVVPDDGSIALANTTYGEQEYCSVLQKDNIFAVQFHPEKSGPKGLLIYNTLYKTLNNKEKNK